LKLPFAMWSVFHIYHWLPTSSRFIVLDCCFFILIGFSIIYVVVFIILLLLYVLSCFYFLDHKVIVFSLSCCWFYLLLFLFDGNFRRHSTGFLTWCVIIFFSSCSTIFMVIISLTLHLYVTLFCFKLHHAYYICFLHIIH